MNTTVRGKEKRRFPRVSLPCHLRYLTLPKQAAEYRNATVQDISQGGFSIRTHESFGRKSCFLLDLFLPGANPIRSLATVAWIKTMPRDDGYQIGGSFIEPNTEVGAALEPLIPEP